MLIRPLIEADLKAVLAIEQAVQVTPWSLRMFQESLAYQDLGWVATEADQILGYILVKPVACTREADILGIAVRIDAQRKGYGKALLAYAAKQFACLYLEVRVSNAAAIALYQHAGFRIISKREKYYQNEAAWVMKFGISKFMKAVC